MKNFGLFPILLMMYFSTSAQIDSVRKITVKKPNKDSVETKTVEVKTRNVLGLVLTENQFYRNNYNVFGAGIQIRKSERFNKDLNVTVGYIWHWNQPIKGLDLRTTTYFKSAAISASYSLLFNGGLGYQKIKFNEHKYQIIKPIFEMGLQHSFYIFYFSAGYNIFLKSPESNDFQNFTLALNWKGSI